MWNADAEARLDGSFEVASLPKIYIQGGLICLTNPKVSIFITFIFPQTVDAGKALVPQLLVLGTCGALLSFIAHAVY
jgi:threonine/homoserine/homoserine lactone efflux protein